MSTDAYRVTGCCPSCGHRDLWLRIENGLIYCDHEDCDNSQIVSQILSDSETEHVIRVHPYGGHTVRHPLRERAGDLFACSVTEDLHYDGFAYRLPEGDYRVIKTPRGWSYTPLKEEEPPQ